MSILEHRFYGFLTLSVFKRVFAIDPVLHDAPF